MANIAEWEGYVADLDADTAWVRAIELPAPNNSYPTLEIELPLTVFSKDDAEALVLGTYVEMFVTEEEKFVVRRKDVGVWTQEDLDAAKARAEDLLRRLNWD